jgi:hypothetical protein
VLGLVHFEASFSVWGKHRAALTTSCENHGLTLAGRARSKMLRFLVTLH